MYALYSNNEDWKALAKAAGVKQSTAYWWIAKQNQQEKQRGGQRILKISVEIGTSKQRIV